jgi:hypothetical protein
MMTEQRFAAALCAALLVGCAALVSCASQRAGGGDSAAPRFHVDPAWPQPLPNNWILGQVSGVAVDGDDHVWVLQRPRSLSEDEAGAALNPPQAKCCLAALPVLEFDPVGRLLRSWGGPGAGYDWPGRQQRHDTARPPRGCRSGCRSKRSVCRRWIPQPARHRVRRGNRRVQTALGRLRQTRQRRQAGVPTHASADAGAIAAIQYARALCAHRARRPGLRL